MLKNRGAALALVGLLVLGVYSVRLSALQQTPPHDHEQPAKTPHTKHYGGDQTAIFRADDYDDKGQEKTQWNENDWKERLSKIFGDHITDWLLVVFTGILAIYTGRLFHATNGLVESDRAWMTWDKYTFADINNSTFGGEMIKRGHAIASCWENTGRSPALNVSCVNIKRMIKPGDAVTIFTIAPDDLITEQSSRGVGAEVSGFFVTLNDIESDDFRNKKRNVVFYSRVEYTDIFKRKIIRVSEACFELEFTGGAMFRGREPTAPITMRLVGTQNGIT
jgi:hypothetical protein